MGRLTEKNYRLNLKKVKGMNEYTIRKATLDDIPFLSDVIIAAEKGPSCKLGFSTLFNLPELKVKELMMSMLREEIDGCEFSISSFLITEFNGSPVSSVSGWIEGFDGTASKTLKSNLISFIFPQKSIEFLKEKSYLLHDLSMVREQFTLQYEYAYVAKEHRGKRLVVTMMEKLKEQSKKIFPAIQKAQTQCYKNNIASIRLLSSIGFEIVQEVKSDDPVILDYLPYNIKILWEKNI
jgi:hypothetical protein